MLNRRYLRIKVMQALYAFFQSDNKDMAAGEKELFKNLVHIYDLYIYLLQFITEIRHQAEILLEDRKNKQLPTPEDLEPNTRFINNKLIRQLWQNKQLNKEALNRKISWQEEGELIRKVLASIRTEEEFIKYLSSPEHSYKEDQDLVIILYKKYISDFEMLIHFFEERSIYWTDDIRLVNPMVIKTLESFSEASGPDFALLPLYKDEEEDKVFVSELFRKTILNDSDNEKLIGDRTKNWDVERIALMDVLLMKMAVTELMSFQNIPVKVTLNEYIEISKIYSTPKSKLFINGVLDKLVNDLKEQGKFQKSGRGLIE